MHLEYAQHLLFLLLQALGFGLFGGSGFDRLGLIGAGAGIRVPFFDVDVSLFAQLGQIGAECGLQLLVVKSVLNLGPTSFNGGMPAIW